MAGLARLGGDDMVCRLAGRRLPVVTTTALTRRALESTGQMAALAVDSEMRSDEREPSAEMVEDRTCTLLRICELRREPRAQRNKNCEQRLACSAFSHSSPKLFGKTGAPQSLRSSFRAKGADKHRRRPSARELLSRMRANLPPPGLRRGFVV
jgi:hypothetical protein